MESMGTKSPFWDRPRRRNPRIWSRRGTVAWRVVPRTIRTSRCSIPIINNNLPGNSRVELDPFFLIAIKEITEIGMWILIKRLRDRFYVSQFPSTWKIDRGREIRILQSQNLFIYLFIHYLLIYYILFTYLYYNKFKFSFHSLNIRSKVN